LRSRERFGFLSPSRQACEVRFGAFEKIECIFFIASEESFGEVARVFLAKKHKLDAGSDNIGC